MDDGDGGGGDDDDDDDETNRPLRQMGDAQGGGARLTRSL